MLLSQCVRPQPHTRFRIIIPGPVIIQARFGIQFAVTIVLEILFSLLGMIVVVGNEVDIRIADRAMDQRQPLGERSRRVGVDRAAADIGQPGPRSLDQSPAGIAQAGVDGEIGRGVAGGLIFNQRPLQQCVDAAALPIHP